MEEQLSKYFSGESSQEEEEHILKWRSENKENSAFFLSCKVFFNIPLKPKPIEILPECLLKTIIKKNEPKNNQSKSFKYISIAAVVSLLLLFVFLLINNTTKSTVSLAVSHELSDGTILKCYPEASFRVLDMDGAFREVSVKGKVFFDVKKDESKPFIVRVGNTKITVLGTSFSVESIKKGTTEIMVTSGIVEIQHSSMSAMLEEGDKVKIDEKRGKIEQSKIMDYNSLAWASEIFYFDGHQLGEVKTLLEEVFDLQVIFEDQGMKNCFLSATFNQKSVTEIAHAISTTFGWDYKLEKGKLIFKGKGLCD